MHLEIDRVADEELAAIQDQLSKVLTDVRDAVEDWQRMHAQVDRSSRTSRSTRRRCRPRSSSRARRCCAGWATTTSPSSATASTPSRRGADERGAGRRARHRLRHPARRPAGPARAARGRRLAGPRQAPAGAGQGQLQGDRAPAGPPRLRRGEEVRRATARSSASAASSGLFSSAAYTESVRRIPVLREKADAGDRRRRARPDEPRRQGADGRARDLPARRAVPDPGRGPGADRRRR